jgi:hypothetical protein
MQRWFTAGFVLLLSIGSGCSDRTEVATEEAAVQVAPEEAAVDTAAVAEARATAEVAYIFAYPMLEHYRTVLGLLRAEGTSFYIGAFNVFDHDTALLGPEVEVIVRPNNDTLYSKAVLDLRAEPMVLSVPAVSDDRYYSFQFIDLYTHNIGFVGTRATGSGPGSYLIAGPSWSGEPPPGIDGVIRSEGNIVVALGRTAVAGAADIPNVEALQAGYRLSTRSAFLGEPPPPTPPEYDLPVFTQERAESPEFLDDLAFLLDQVEVDGSEAALIAQFLALREALDDPAIREAVQQGIDAGREEIAAAVGSLGKERNGWSLMMRLFGNREAMQGRYLTRAAGAMFGLWGNDEAEAYYPTANADDNGEPLDGSRHRYELHFEADQLPDVEGFWSITMYDLPRQLMVANPIDRYSIGDRTEGVAYGEDGSLTLYLQSESPGLEKQSNWLPAPDGPFSATLRMYIPSAEALAGPYAPPPITRVD